MEIEGRSTEQVSYSVRTAGKRVGDKLGRCYCRCMPRCIQQMQTIDA